MNPDKALERSYLYRLLRRSSDRFQEIQLSSKTIVRVFLEIGLSILVIFCPFCYVDLGLPRRCNSDGMVSRVKAGVSQGCHGQSLRLSNRESFSYCKSTHAYLSWFAPSFVESRCRRLCMLTAIQARTPRAHSNVPPGSNTSVNRSGRSAISQST